MMKTTLSYDRYVQWWLDDYPPLSGLERLLLLAGLAYFAIYVQNRTFVSSMDAYEQTDPEMFSTRGVLGFLGISYMEPEHVRALVHITCVAYVMATVGLCTDYSTGIAAVGATFLQGFFLDITGGNRCWYLGTGLVIAVACSSCNKDVWSLDYHLKRWWGRNAAKRQCSCTAQTNSNSNATTVRSIRETGFARKCFLVYVVGFYCASGFAKLYASGFKWGDGKTIQHHLRGHDNFFANLLMDYQWLAVMSSVGTLFLEAGAFLVLLFPSTRPFFFINWSVMHIMIKLTMGPTYTQHIWCYIMLVNWSKVHQSASKTWRRHCEKLFRRARGKGPVEVMNKETESLDVPLALPASTLPLPPLKVGPQQDIPKSVARTAVIVGTLLLVLMTAQVVFQIEFWPLTNVDMYSAYSDSGMILKSFPEKMYREAVGAQTIARSSIRLARDEVVMNAELQLRKENDGDGKPKSIKSFGVHRDKQWKKSIMRLAVIADLSAKPDGRIEWDPNHPDNPASLLLRRVLPSLKRNVKKWEQYDKVVMTYDIEGGPKKGVVIGSIPLHSKEDESSGSRTINGTPTRLLLACFILAGLFLLFGANVSIKTYAKKIFGIKRRAELPSGKMERQSASFLSFSPSSAVMRKRRP
jgi:hypothetical protein